MAKDKTQIGAGTSQTVVDLGPMFTSTLQATSQRVNQADGETLDSTADVSPDKAEPMIVTLVRIVQ
jgi:hypothetical protein